MGRHHKPSTTGRRIAQAAIVVTALPAGAALIGAGTASAAEPTGVLDEIARCESGGNPRAQNPSSTASGTYQFLDSTWRSIGGTGRAKDASPAEQRRMAEKLLAQQGTTPWNASKSCWGGRSGASAPSAERSSSAGESRQADRPAAKKKAKPQVRTVAPKVKKEAEVRSSSPRPAPAASVPAAAKFTSGGDGPYVVKAGDTLSHLAKKHGTTVQRLMDLNKDVLELPGWIFTGEKIHLG